MSDYKFVSLEQQVKLIPDITDDEIEEMLGQIVPVVYQDIGGRHGQFRAVDIEDVDRRKTAYTWEPKLGREVGLSWNGFGTTSIITYHRWGYYGFFKPSLAETLAQIRYVMTDWKLVKFFCLDTNLFDSGNWRNFVVGQHHWCKCHLWGPNEEHDVD